GDILVELPRFAVVLYSLVEVALLVVFSTQSLLLIGSLLGLLFLEGLLIELLGLGLRFSCGRGLSGRLRRSRDILHLSVLLLSLGVGRRLLARRNHVHVHTHQDTEDLDH